MSVILSGVFVVLTVFRARFRVQDSHGGHLANYSVHYRYDICQPGDIALWFDSLRLHPLIYVRKIYGYTPSADWSVQPAMYMNNAVPGTNPVQSADLAEEYQLWNVHSRLRACPAS